MTKMSQRDAIKCQKIVPCYVMKHFSDIYSRLHWEAATK